MINLKNLIKNHTKLREGPTRTPGQTRAGITCLGGVNIHSRPVTPTVVSIYPLQHLQNSGVLLKLVNIEYWHATHSSMLFKHETGYFGCISYYHLGIFGDCRSSLSAFPRRVKYETDMIRDQFQVLRIPIPSTLTKLILETWCELIEEWLGEIDIRVLTWIDRGNDSRKLEGSILAWNIIGREWILRNNKSTTLKQWMDRVNYQFAITKIKM